MKENGKGFFFFEICKLKCKINYIFKEKITYNLSSEVNSKEKAT
jgi:hypothetical protein